MTLVLIKPDAVRRGLVGEIIGRIERKGLHIVAAKLLKPSRDLAERHYAEHKGKEFYDGLIDFITSGPLMALAVHGVNAVSACRQLAGKTNPIESAPGTIRGDFGLLTSQNLIHASDSPASAAREVGLWFNDSEIFHTDLQENT